MRTILNIFRKNSQQFGFYSSAMSIAEMIVKFYGRSYLKQFLKNKPISFGIKLWAFVHLIDFYLIFLFIAVKMNELMIEECKIVP